MNWKIVTAVGFGVAIVAIPAFMKSAAEQEATFAKIEAMSADQKLADGWAYKDQVDEMRGEKARVASVRAEGWIPMSPELYVFKNPKHDPQIAIRGSLDEVTAPQMRCIGGTFNIKFDDGPIRKVACQMGMSVVIDPSILPSLRKSANTWIEIDTSIGSSMQYKFRTANLEI